MTLPPLVRLTRNLKVNPALLAVIPLVTVLFLVVIFFALSSRFVLQPGLAVSLPASSFTLDPRQDAQIVSIVSAPVPAIYFHEQKVAREELAEHLRKVPGRQRSLIVRADRATPYEEVIGVMNVALQQGFSIVLATSPEPP